MNVILIYIVIIAVLILPTYFSNKKKKQQKRTMLENLKEGDKITTIGGIQGTIMNIFTNTVEIKIDKSARLTIVKSAIDFVEKE